MSYVQKLIDKMNEQGEDKEYIELCAAYAQKLCDNNVPVVLILSIYHYFWDMSQRKLPFIYLHQKNCFIRKSKYQRRMVAFEILKSRVTD